MKSFPSSHGNRSRVVQCFARISNDSSSSSMPSQRLWWLSLGWLGCRISKRPLWLILASAMANVHGAPRNASARRRLASTTTVDDATRNFLVWFVPTSCTQTKLSPAEHAPYKLVSCYTIQMWVLLQLGSVLLIVFSYLWIAHPKK
jgi:hypothetical protein